MLQVLQYLPILFFLTLPPINYPLLQITWNNTVGIVLLLASVGLQPQEGAKEVEAVVMVAWKV